VLEKLEIESHSGNWKIESHSAAAAEALPPFAPPVGESRSGLGS
jgi:hypothetical protein